MKAAYFPAVGTAAQNRRYCTKCCDECYKLKRHIDCDDSHRLLGPWEEGVCPNAAGKTAVIAMVSMLKKGRGLKDIMEAFPSAYIRHWRNLKHMQLMLNDTNESRGKPKVVWYHGLSGAGKSKKVRELFPDAYWKPKGKWWPNYDMQKIVILDEFYGWMELDAILRLVDWHPHKDEYKGGYVPMKANCFVFTSNVNPRTLYTKYPWVRRHAFFRRLSEFGTIWKWNETKKEFFLDNIKLYYAKWNENPAEHDMTIMTQRVSNYK